MSWHDDDVEWNAHQTLIKLLQDKGIIGASRIVTLVGNLDKQKFNIFRQVVIEALPMDQCMLKENYSQTFILPLGVCSTRNTTSPVQLPVKNAQKESVYI